MNRLNRDLLTSDMHGIMRDKKENTMKKRKRWKFDFLWSELKVSEGGRGNYLIDMFKSEGIKAKRDNSPFIGHVGIRVWIVNKKEAEKAARILGSSADYLYSEKSYVNNK